VRERPLASCLNPPIKSFNEIITGLSASNWVITEESGSLLSCGICYRVFLVYRVLVGKPEVKRPLGRPRSRWEDNIKMDFQEVECRGYGLDRAGSL